MDGRAYKGKYGPKEIKIARAHPPTPPCHGETTKKTNPMCLITSPPVPAVHLAFSHGMPFCRRRTFIFYYHFFSLFLSVSFSSVSSSLHMFCRDFFPSFILYAHIRNLSRCARYIIIMRTGKANVTIHFMPYNNTIYSSIYIHILPKLATSYSQNLQSYE